MPTTLLLSHPDLKTQRHLCRYQICTVYTQQYFVELIFQFTEHIFNLTFISCSFQIIKLLFFPCSFQWEENQNSIGKLSWEWWILQGIHVYVFRYGKNSKGRSLRHGQSEYWTVLLSSPYRSRMYLKLPLRQWVAGNVYLLVLSSWKVNIAENPITVMGL